MLKISRSSTFYFLRYAHVRYVKSVFTNIQKQQNMLKISLLFQKFTKLQGADNSRIRIIQNAKNFKVLFVYEHKHRGRFSNLHWCTFKLSVIDIQVLLSFFLFWFEKILRLQLYHTNLITVCTHPSFCRGEGVEPPTKFSKRGGLDRASTFRGGLLGKRGNFFQGRGLQIST